MNWDQLAGSLKQLEGQVKQGWATLINSEEIENSGWRDEMEGMVQEHFGVTKETVEEKVNLFRLWD
jgi:uncharacterized protein YjbJ (UPF0337 family)